MSKPALTFLIICAAAACWYGTFGYVPVARVSQTLWQSLRQAAAVLLAHDPKSVTDLRRRYRPVAQTKRAKTETKVKVLIVPGHEPGFGGAEWGAVKERDLTAELAQDLAKELESDGHYEVTVSRTAEAWSPIFRQYFSDQWEAIKAWQTAAREEVRGLVAAGEIAKPVSAIKHTRAADDVAFRLYGLTKWANENDQDIVLHLHFNDYPGRSASGEGRYSGFAVYVPVEQYGNGATSRAVAEKIFDRLRRHYPVSDLPGEQSGLIDEAELIAIGANNTADAASLLIEYGYIYEPGLANTELRPTVLKDLALQTYLGLQDFFEDGVGSYVDEQVALKQSAWLPAAWPGDALAAESAAPREVLALQTALAAAGAYPPAGQTKNDCPRSGRWGACTRAALAAFQAQNGLPTVGDRADDATMAALKKLF